MALAGARRCRAHAPWPGCSRLRRACRGSTALAARLPALRDSLPEARLPFEEPLEVARGEELRLRAVGSTNSPRSISARTAT